MRMLFGDFVFDRGSRRLLRGGDEVPLGPKAFDLLDLLLSRQPEAVSKTLIRDQLWPRTFVSESNLTGLVTDLRTALGDEARRPRFVRTVYGFGYAFCGDAQEMADEARNEGVHRGHPRLIYEGREIGLHEGENLLGRTDEAVVWIDSPKVSRRHARIQVSAGGAVLEDLGSRNGTYLRGQKVCGPSALVDGDEILIGQVSMTFKWFWSAEETEEISSERR
jgi:DNA-binding winged helix-turn-helix (wHTH) protein